MNRPLHLLVAIALLCLLPSAAAPAPASAGPALVTGIRCWTSDEYTRVVVDVARPVPYEVGALPADPGRGLPPRVFVDIAGADVRGEILRKPLEVDNGLLRVVRAGRFRRGVVRVVAVLERESGYRVFEMEDPYRIVIDIEGGGQEGVRAEEDRGREEAVIVPEGSPGEAQRPAPHAQRPVVMIDPGHGGKDPGAIGQSGLREKDVVLAIGLLVRDKLRALRGYDVRMTRDSDVFIPLEERTAMANRARADLFVSLHINASRDRRAQGISTYVLSRSSSDREALELAARENGVPVEKLSAVRFIIDDLSTYGRKNESLRLAKTVNDAIVRNVRHRYGAVEDLGLKQAPFYVLVGARMTAILVESSFITNPREEARLSDRAYLETIADSVVEAIRFYSARRTMARAGS